MVDLVPSRLYCYLINGGVRMWKLFLDDEREPVGDGWIIARSYDSARALVIEQGLPCFISFDHDLGEGENGSQFVSWMVNHMIDQGMRFPSDFSYMIHSQNPIGAGNIRGKMDAAIRHIGRW